MEKDFADSNGAPSKNQHVDSNASEAVTGKLPAHVESKPSRCKQLRQWKQTLDGMEELLKASENVLIRLAVLAGLLTFAYYYIVKHP